jgi:hypothetical protein
VNDRVLPALMLLVGVVIVLQTLLAGREVTSGRLLIGALLAVAGGLRFWAERRRRAS